MPVSGLPAPGLLQVPRDYGVVTALPTSPTPLTNDRCTYTDSLTAPTFYWQLVYNASDSGSYKWAVVGGSPQFAEVLTDQSTTSATYAALTTAGPSITVPLAGDYDVMVAAASYQSSLGNGNRMSYDIGATGAVDADSACFTGSNAGSGIGTLESSRRKTGLAASTALVSKYKVNAGTGDFLNRRMTAKPVRVG